MYREDKAGGEGGGKKDRFAVRIQVTAELEPDLPFIPCCGVKLVVLDESDDVAELIEMDEFKMPNANPTGLAFLICSDRFIIGTLGLGMEVATMVRNLPMSFEFRCVHPARLIRVEGYALNADVSSCPCYVDSGCASLMTAIKVTKIEEVK